jgi:hypothetical protein
MTRTALVAYHGRCFDGMCSAALVSRVLEAHLHKGGGGPGLSFGYRGLEHQPGGSHVPPDVLTGEINAVVDFRYSTSPKLGWWFDHHGTGIVGDEERAHFERERAHGTKFFEPAYGSCCKLIADTARDRFGVSLQGLEDMIHWADMIDAARFPDARTAVELGSPALRLMTVIEAHGDERFLASRIKALSEGATLDELAAHPRVQKLFGPLQERHRETLEEIRAKSRFAGGVVSFDLSGSGSDRYNKFIPYFLEPDARYCVAVTASKSRAKISVGSNPWAAVARSHNIAEICARYGGGGHPVVGAISLPPGEIERARQIAELIIAELSR